MFKILNNKYNIETIKFENNNERDKLEQYFSELIPLIQTRWSSICGYKRLWKSRRMEYRQEINTILDTEMKKLAESTDAVDQTKWVETVDKVIARLEKLITDIEDLLALTESLQAEMEDLFKQREEILVIAHKLFAM